MLAVSIVAAARTAGLRVPQDLAVTGFDDSALAALAVPPITSVRVDYAAFGAAAAEALLGLLAGEEPAPPRLTVPRLVVRASTLSRQTSAGSRSAAGSPAAGAPCASPTCAAAA